MSFISIGVLWMYLKVVIFEKTCQLDYRFIWPFFRGFSWSGLGQFFVYLPVFAQLGPGEDLFFGTTFGGSFMPLLIVFAPQVLVFSFVCTYCYRKSGNTFLGAIIVAMLATWIVTGGSAMLYA